MIRTILSGTEDFVAHLLWFLSSLLPRDKRRWVFMGWQRTADGGDLFTDNAKYLFLYLNKHRPDIKIVWLSKSPAAAKRMSEAGLPACYDKSLKGIWYTLRAGVGVLDAFINRDNYRFIGRAKIVQLLHGKGMKQGGYSLLPYSKKNDHIFLPSSFVDEILSPVFKAGARVHVTGYPRSDGILGCDYELALDTNSADLAKLKNLRATGEKCLWYAPTFRRGQTEIDIDKILQLETLLPTLDSIGAHLFISLHPKYRSILLTSTSQRIHILSAQDFFPLYQYFDLLITDYSSSFVDFLLLNRPLLFYPYDLADYMKNEGISVDYDAITPGPKVYEASKLADSIAAIFKHDAYAKKRQAVRDQYHTYVDSHNARRVMEILDDQLSLKSKP